MRGIAISAFVLGTGSTDLAGYKLCVVTPGMRKSGSEDARPSSEPLSFPSRASRRNCDYAFLICLLMKSMVLIRKGYQG